MHVRPRSGLVLGSFVEAALTFARIPDSRVSGSFGQALRMICRSGSTEIGRASGLSVRGGPPNAPSWSPLDKHESFSGHYEPLRIN
jgi:hypothetical protein